LLFLIRIGGYCHDTDKLADILEKSFITVDVGKSTTTAQQ